MKKFSKVSSNDSLRPVLAYVQVKNGFFYATNCHVLVKIPVSEVLGNNELISNDEEIYFNAKQWDAQKFYKAMYITRDGMIFKAIDKKGNLIGMIEAMNIEQFNDKIGKFYDCEAILPNDSKPIESVKGFSMNPEYYFNVCECLELENNAGIYMQFYGTTKAAILKSTTSGGIGLIMPRFNSQVETIQQG